MPHLECVIKCCFSSVEEISFNQSCFIFLDLPHLQILPNKPPPMVPQFPRAPAKEYLCPFCNSKYNNVGNFKQHMKFHESEAAKEERSQMMNDMVASSFSKFSIIIDLHKASFRNKVSAHARKWCSYAMNAMNLRIKCHDISKTLTTVDCT